MCLADSRDLVLITGAFHLNGFLPSRSPRAIDSRHPPTPFLGILIARAMPLKPRINYFWIAYWLIGHTLKLYHYQVVGLGSLTSLAESTVGYPMLQASEGP